MRKTIAGWLIALSALAPSFAAEIVQRGGVGFLKSVIIQRTQDALEVKITVVPYNTHRVFELARPSRIVVDFYGIHGIETDRFFEVDFPQLKSIRVGQFRNDVVRVVVDAWAKIPLYRIEPQVDGIKIFLFREGLPPDQASFERQRQDHEETLKEKPVTAEKQEALEAEAQASEAIDKPPAEQDVPRVDQTGDRPLSFPLPQRKRFFRVETIGNYFRPAEGPLRDNYEDGFMFGAELSVGVMPFLEVWTSLSQMAKKVAFSSGEVRKLDLVPLEAGIKIRPLRGIVNPYLGLGLGYYQFKELVGDVEIRENQLGLVAQGGVFAKLGGFIVIDFFTFYRRCRITVDSEDWDIGGLNFGFGFGIEY